MKKALITGISGQDGYYLSHLLLEKGYDVHGFDLEKGIEKSSTILDKRVKLYPCNLLDVNNCEKLLLEIKADEIYNLASQSSPAYSFKNPNVTFQVNVIGLHVILEIIRLHLPEAKLFQASSADIFGNSPGVKHEESRINPASPYAASKASAHLMVKSYRESYGLYLLNGILFPHESPMRGENFVSHKITKAAAMIKLGKQDKLLLGDVYTKRDWGYAVEYVEAMHACLQYERPEDFLISSGKAHSITDILEIAFGYFDLNWKDYVEKDESLVRPVDIEELVGDSSKAKKLLGWEPRKSFEEIIEEMVKSDYENLK